MNILRAHKQSDTAEREPSAAPARPLQLSRPDAVAPGRLISRALPHHDVAALDVAAFNSSI